MDTKIKTFGNRISGMACSPTRRTFTAMTLYAKRLKSRTGHGLSEPKKRYEVDDESLLPGKELSRIRR